MNHLWLTKGLLSPPTTADTFPSVNDILRMLELSLSATKTACNSSATLRPDGCANPAACGYELLRFSSLPLPTIAAHVPAGYNLKYTVHEFVYSVYSSGSSLLWEEYIL
jgi:hypothetical protein